MSQVISTVLLSALIIQASEPQRSRDVVDIFRCDFEAGSDVNFDRWPDRWTRLRDRDHPAFLPIEIDGEDAAVGKRYLRIQLNGGAASLYSPKIEVSPHFSYVLGGFIRTEGLKNDVVYCQVAFYDGNDKLLHRHRTKALDPRRWEKILSDPIAVEHQSVQYAVVELHLEPQLGLQPDLHGAACFDDIWLGRLPRVSVKMNHPNHLYDDRNDIVVSCNVSGVSDENPQIEFELFDVHGTQIATEQQQLNGRPVQASADPVKPSTSNADAELGYTGVADWTPPIPDFGYYRIRVTMAGSKGIIHQSEVSLAVMLPLPLAGSHGEFGWTLPAGDQHVPMEQLADLVMHAGVSWVKYPVWYSEHETTRPEEITWFAERLKKNGTKLVGLLDQPPPDIHELFGEANQLEVAQVFADNDLWQKHLNPVLTRLSLKIRWWQLGRDKDISFFEYPDLLAKIDTVRQQLERFGQESHLGIGWKWIYELPAVSNPPWKFLTLTSDPPLTATELQAYLDQPSSSSVKRWVVMEPLSRNLYDPETRSGDLVHRMVAAKVHAADAIFLPDPFDSQHGLMQENATPNDLFLTWRTTARLLTGAEYLGKLEMPGQSHNRVFQKGDEAILVVWNEEPTTETMFLGNNVRLINKWGQSASPAQDGHRQVIPVGPQPVFLSGVNLPITRWRLDFAFDRENLASTFSHPQRAFYRIVNSFPQGVTGSMTLQTPYAWETDLRAVHFKLAEGTDRSEQFVITLQPVARSGRHQVCVHFDVSADRIYSFNLYRHLELGLRDVSIEVTTDIDEDGNLVVSQQLTNQNDQVVNFDCMLFAPERRRQRRHILNLGRGRNSQTYILPQGEQLIGKTIWLRAEEIGGARMLNHQIVVER